jgi:hypothetical protein
MDSYRQDCTYIAGSGPIPATFKTLSPGDKATFRNWRRAVLAFYGAVLLFGGVMLVTSIPVAHQEIAQVRPAVNVP